MSVSLAGRARWLMWPSTIGNSVVALLAAQYAAATIHLPEGSLGTFWLLVVTVGSIGVVGAEVLAARRLKTLRGVATGRVMLDQPHRLAAIEEVRNLPVAIGRLGVGFWFGSVLLVALGFGGSTDATLQVTGRLVMTGLLFGPMAAVVVGLLVARRAHVVIEQLAEGLSPEAVSASLTASRGSVRGRLVLFTVVMVALPALVLIDVTRSLGRELAEAAIAVAPADRAAWEDGAWWGLLARVGLLFGLSGAMAIVSAAVGGSLLSRPLQRVAQDAQGLAAGRLSQATLIAGDGEVWLISNVFARLKERLLALVGRLRNATGRLTSATGTLERSARESEVAAAEQAAALNQTSATTEELAQSARQIASSAASVQELAQKTLEAAESGLASADAFRSAIERMRQDNRSIASAVERLTGRVHQIGRIVDVINSVADRSDLLALSAELEGTRAGDVGRGFSLVAAEMRRLAENVLESTAEVEELISEIRTATRQTADATERARALTEGSTSLADEVARALTSVAVSAKQTTDAVRTISLATQQQQTGTDQLAEAMTDILAITQQSLANTRQLVSANERLQAFSQTLTRVVGGFQRRA